MNCPSCGESNTTDMAFCIFCGAPLKSPQNLAASGAQSLAASGRQTRVSEMGQRPAPRTCVNCGQTDSLNSSFCIFCGNRVDGVPGVAMGASSGAQSAMQPVTPAPVEPAVSVHGSSKKSGAGVASALLGCLFAGMLGAGAGAATSYYLNANTEAPKAVRELPQRGLVILTAVPYSSFEIISDGRRFITGKTGKDGDIALSNVEPNKYNVIVKSPRGDSWQGDIVVKSGEPFIIGEQKELFASE